MDTSATTTNSQLPQTILPDVKADPKKTNEIPFDIDHRPLGASKKNGDTLEGGHTKPKNNNEHHHSHHSGKSSNWMEECRKKGKKWCIEKLVQMKKKGEDWGVTLSADDKADVSKRCSNSSDKAVVKNCIIQHEADLVMNKYYGAGTGSSSSKPGGNLATIIGGAVGGLLLLILIIYLLCCCGKKGDGSDDSKKPKPGGKTAKKSTGKKSAKKSRKSTGKSKKTGKTTKTKKSNKTGKK